MPCRLRKLKKRAGEFGIELKSGGNHLKFTRKGASRPYPVKAHKGLNSEISDYYISGLCRHFDVDEKQFVDGL